MNPGEFRRPGEDYIERLAFERALQILEEMECYTFVRDYVIALADFYTALASARGLTFEEWLALQRLD